MRIGAWLGFLAVLQLVAGLVNQLAILRLVGIGVVTDAYVAAQAAPLVLAAIAGSALPSVWLPRFSVLAHDRSALHRAVASAQGQALRLLVAPTVLLTATAGWWSNWIFPGFAPAQARLVAELTGPLLGASALSALGALLTASLRASTRFLAAELLALGATLGAIAAAVALVPDHGVIAAAWIAVGRSALIYVVQLHLTGWPGWFLRADASRREVWPQLRTLLMASALIKTNPLVDRYWGSQAAVGGMTALSLGQLAVNSTATILERAIVVPTSPRFARRVAAGDYAGLYADYCAVLRRTGASVAVLMAATLAIYPFSAELLHLALRLPAGAAAQVWTVAALLLPGLFVSVAGTAAVAVFYAFGETAMPSAIGLAGFAAGVLLKGWLFGMMGLSGIAAATSVYLGLNMVAYHIAVRRRIAVAQQR